MNQIAEASILFDLYGKLLTEKKRQVMSLYYEENLSLSEIAEEQGISRAAVHDALKSAEKNLITYEEKLGLRKAYMERQKNLNDLRKELEKSGALKTKSAKSIEKLLSKLED